MKKILSFFFLAILVSFNLQAQFCAPFDLTSDWTFFLGSTDGSVDISGAPNTLVLNGGNNNIGTGSTSATDCSLNGFVKACIILSSDVTIAFDYSYTTVDGGSWDQFGVCVDGVFTSIVNTGNFAAGAYSISLLSGQEFCITQATSDGQYGNGVTTISNFNMVVGNATTQVVINSETPTIGTILIDITNANTSVLPFTLYVDGVSTGVSVTGNGTYTLGSYSLGMSHDISTMIGTCAVPLTSTAAGVSCEVGSVDAGADQEILAGSNASLSASLGNVISIPGGFTVEPGQASSCGIDQTDATSPVNSVALLDDDLSDPITLPAAFDYFGTQYTQFLIGSNGFITFNLSQTASGCCSGEILPTAGDDFINIIALYWEDLDPTDGGSIVHYNTAEGYVIEFINIPHFANPATVSGYILLGLDNPATAIANDNYVAINCINCEADVTNPATSGLEIGDGLGGFSTNSNNAIVGVCTSYFNAEPTNETCEFLGWFGSLADVPANPLSTALNYSVSPTTDATYYAAVNCDGVICVDPVLVEVTNISIVDPCSCATFDITTQLFSDDVVINSEAGLTWTFDASASTGVLNAAGSPQLSDVVLSASAPGEYHFDVYLTDGSPYHATFFNNLGETIFIDGGNCLASDCINGTVGIPTASEWGLMSLFLMLSSILTIFVRQRKTALAS